MPRTALVVAPFALAALALAACGLAACGGAAVQNEKEPPRGGSATGFPQATATALFSAAPPADESGFLRVGEVSRAESAAAPAPTTSPTTPPAGGPTKSGGEKGTKSEVGQQTALKKPERNVTPLTPESTPTGIQGAVVDSTSGLTEADVRSTIMGKSAALRECYDLGGANFSGMIALRVAIGPTGTVASAEVITSTTQAARVDSCVLGKVRAMQFPSKGTGAVISFPIEFGR